STDSSKETIEQMREFGEKVGMAFQIKDDLFDYGDDEIGKPLGIDIKEKKMTLPLIFALQKADWFEKKKIINLIRNRSDDKKAVNQVINFVKKSGGLDYAKTIMDRFYREALDILKTFPDSDYKTSLECLVSYTIERKK
ncbi:polyprenyl synthetase family protein, partial [Algoriphagus sp.]|uniref:polyprenyl synthetase family protein n=1 Tax=Algoriphagus sp. TaxID=1872435 RepID=UPI0025E209A1